MSTELRQLSEREREILELVATGLSNQQIALRLGISANTVKVHLRNIFAKIGAASRTEATMYAVRGGLVPVHVQTSAATERHPEPVFSVVEDVEQDQDDSVCTLADAPQTATADEPVPDLADTTAPIEHHELLSPPESETGVVVPATIDHHAARPLRWPLLGLAAAAVVVVVLGVLWATGMFNRLAQPTTGTAPQRWLPREPMSMARAGFAVASFDDLIYVAGGEASSGVVALLERYDPGMQTWTSLSQKPTPVTDVKAVVIGGKLYIPGGRRSRPLDDITTAFEAYDFRTDSWEQQPELPSPRSGYGLVTVEGKLLLFGGWDGRSYRAEVLEYDPGTRLWSERTPMPTARAYAEATIVGGTIYVMGGENESGALDNNEQYLPTSEGNRPWTKRQPLPTPRSRFGTAVALNLISVLGGVQQDALPLQYNARTDSWTSLQPPPQPLGSQPGVIQNDVLTLSFGGKQQNGEYSDQVLTYQSFYSVAFPQVGGNPK